MDAADIAAVVANVCGDATAKAALVACLISADAGNELVQGTDGGLVHNENLTGISYDATATTITYTDEDGNDTVIDLSALAADIFVNGGSFDPDYIDPDANG